MAAADTEIQTPIKPHSMGDGDAFMALPGKFVKATISKFCQKESDPPQVLDSIGVGHHGIAATDRHRGIIIGEPDPSYAVTDRRCAMLESDRSTIYNEGYDAGKVLPVEDEGNPDNCPPFGDFPNLGKIISEVESMRYLASVDPAYLRDLAAVALAGNVPDVALYVDDSGEKVKLGFRFTHINLDPSFGEALKVPVVGVIMGRAVTKDKARESEDDEETADASVADAIRDMAALGTTTISIGGKSVTISALDADPLVEEAAYWIVGGGKPGLQSIQARFQCGKDRALRIRKALHALGVIDAEANPPAILIDSPEVLKQAIECARRGI